MPIYGYRCQSCSHEFEVLQRMTDPAVAACPDCGGAGSRLFYPAGILFKGSGFYKTDSRSNGASASGDSAARDSTPPGAKDGKGASAPATSPAGGEAPATPAATPASSTTTAADKAS